MENFDPNKQIAIIWSIEDVQQERPHLTNEQAMEVLREVEHHHDANYGVCWETLRTVADNLFPKRKEYRIRGCKEKFGKVEILGDSEDEQDEAEYWGVYETQEDDTEKWLADFYEYSDAQMFALEKEKEETK